MNFSQRKRSFKVNKEASQKIDHLMKKIAGIKAEINELSKKIKQKEKQLNLKEKRLKNLIRNSMRCKERGCNGRIDVKNPIIILAAAPVVPIPEEFYSCKKCGRVHCKYGSVLRSERGKLFYEDGFFIYKKRNKIVAREKYQYQSLNER